MGLLRAKPKPCQQKFVSWRHPQIYFVFFVRTFVPLVVIFCLF